MVWRLVVSCVEWSVCPHGGVCELCYLAQCGPSPPPPPAPPSPRPPAVAQPRLDVLDVRGRPRVAAGEEVGVLLEARPGRLSSSAAEVALALVASGGIVLPAPGLGRRLRSHPSSVAEVHSLGRELVRRRLVRHLPVELLVVGRRRDSRAGRVSRGNGNGSTRV